MNNKVVITIVIIILLLIIFNKKVMGIASMVKSFAIRNDSQGLGKFGTLRQGHTHQGLDIKVSKGDEIKAPFDMVYSYSGRVYKDDPKYIASEYKTKNGTFRVMYMTPKSGKATFKAGEVIGVAQSIKEKWGSSMQDHIHVEVRENGVLKDPEKYL